MGENTDEDYTATSREERGFHVDRTDGRGGNRCNSFSHRRSKLH